GLLLGSDAPQVFNVPGFSLHRELDAIVASGLTPFEALRTGTLNPAVFFEATEEFGAVRAGLAADLILAARNPLEDVTALARPEGVMVRGRWLDRAELDRGLAEIAARYTR
ncbi:MAG TPA: amidohydrolase family protein, partial [Gammaproteobacteria bacterium]|nr:amidohydrolase family protein [Gammaproteobacteria bacterium]